ncbi:hypothetical protein, partial [Flavobacterium sp. Root186]|uniref:hypothetical protein n=1 Tax=Flavobacterium sp. Root186 TaxID=1736485 RepID=UPI000A9506EA
ITTLNAIMQDPNGITTLNAIMQDPNGDIYAYIGTKNTAAERDAEWVLKTNWVRINGNDGTDGLAGPAGIGGATGAPGTPGSITTLNAIMQDPNGDIYAYEYS